MGFFDALQTATPSQPKTSGGFFDTLSEPITKKAAAAAPLDLSSTTTPLGTAQSTPSQAKPETPDVLDYLFNPHAQTKIQPLGFTKEQAPTFTGPRAIFGPTKIITEFFTDFIKGAGQAVSDVSKLAASKKAPINNITIPNQAAQGFLPEGATDEAGHIRSAAERTVARQKELDLDTPTTPGLNAAQAMFEVGVPAAFNVLFAEDIGKNLTQDFLKKTGFQSTLGLQYSKLSNVPAEDFVKTVSDRTREVVTGLADDLKAGKITQKQAEAKMNQIQEEYHNLGSLYKDQNSPKLNKLGQLFENASIALNEDVSQLGKRDYAPLQGAVRPAGETLPGSRPVPGQAPAFGLSTEAVENVGGTGGKKGFFDDLTQGNVAENPVSKPENTPSTALVKKNVQAESPIIKGDEVANKLKTMGTSGGVSDFLLDTVKKEDYKVQTVKVSDLLASDPALKDYIDGTKGKLRNYKSSDAAIPPIVTSKGEVWDGYNRIAQAIKSGQTDIEVYKGVTSPYAGESDLSTRIQEAKKYKSAEEFIDSSINLPSKRDYEKDGGVLTGEYKTTENGESLNSKDIKVGSDFYFKTHANEWEPDVYDLVYGIEDPARKGQQYIITEVLENGDFRARPKYSIRSEGDTEGDQITNQEQTFNIDSGRQIKNVGDILSPTSPKQWQKVKDVPVDFVDPHHNPYGLTDDVEGQFIFKKDGTDPMILINSHIDNSKWKDILMEEIEHALQWKGNPDFARSGDWHQMKNTEDYLTNKVEKSASRNISKRKQELTDFYNKVTGLADNTKQEYSGVNDTEAIKASDPEAGIAGKGPEFIAGGGFGRQNIGQEVQAYVDIRGKKAKTVGDVAALLKDFRNPKREIIHVVYTSDDGTVLAHSAVTTDQVDIAIFPKGEIPYKIEQRAQRLNAKNVYIAHNHPSGYVKPSPADFTVTKAIAKKVPQFRAHIVLDHNQFSEISPAGETEVHQVNLGKSYQATSEPVLTPEAASKVFESHYTFEKGKVGILVTNAHSEPIALRVITIKPETIQQTIRQIVKENDGSNAILGVQDADFDLLRENIKREPYVDEVIVKRKNQVYGLPDIVTSSIRSPYNTDPLAKPSKRVREEEGRYTRNGEPKKTPTGKPVGKITIGGKEMDVLKGGGLSADLIKGQEASTQSQRQLPEQKSQTSALGSRSSAQASSLTNTGRTPRPQPREEATLQKNMRTEESLPLPSEPNLLDTSQSLKSSLGNSLSKGKVEVKPVDKLIAQGKIRVVSLGGRDVYQIKKGKEWVSTRDEDSAIRQATAEKRQIALPPKLEQQKIAVEVQKEAIKQNPLAKLNKYVAKSGEFEGKLPELGVGKSEFARRGDAIAQEVLGDATKSAADAVDIEHVRSDFETLTEKKKALAAEEKQLNKEIKTYKETAPKRAAQEKVKALRRDIVDLESSGLNADKQRADVKKIVVQNKLALSAQGHPLKVGREGIPIALSARQKRIVEASEYRDVTPERPSVEGTYGEVKSIEIMAKQAESLVHGVDIPPDVSMRELIEKTVTPVQNKVNIVDTFLRTPSHVMNKIGFGEEAKDLRRAMDGYWKELPKNLEKVGDWLKALGSKKSATQVFDYLDGQAIDLTPDQHYIASEIKAWLREWADRLGLEKDERVTDYITRIFDRDTPQEFDEELAKIIDNKVPASVYNPFTLRRLGARGYKRDLGAALEAYVKRGTRKVYMDPVLEKIRAKTGEELATTNLEKSQFKYVQKYINNINMRPSETDESIDNFIKTVFTNKVVAKIYKGTQKVLSKGTFGLVRPPDIGQRPVASISRFLRQMTSRAMLGLNPGSALRNLSQGINTYAVLGEKYTTIGYINVFKLGASDELEREGVLNAAFVQDKVLSATGKMMERVDKGLYFLFEQAEKINRGAAYFGAKSKALAAGKSEHEAIEYAKEIVRKTQFSFDSVDTPVGMGSDIAKTLFQFQTYTTKQAEFLAGMAKDKNFIGLLRYAIAGLLFVYTIGKAFGMKPQELIPLYRIGLPPSLTVPTEIAQAGLNMPDKYGNTLPLGKRVQNVGTAVLKGSVPAGSEINKAYQGYKAVQAGASQDASGKKQFAVGGSLGRNVQAIAFGKYAAPGASDYFNGISMAERKYEELSKSKTAGSDFEALKRQNPALAKQVAAIKKRRDAGITADDDKIINLGVANGQRAKYVADKLNKLKTKEQKAALWSEYVKKKIITKDVSPQVLTLLKK